MKKRNFILRAVNSRAEYSEFMNYLSRRYGSVFVKEKPEIKVDTDSIIRAVKEQVIAEFKHRCVIWYDIAENPDEDLPPEFERVCNQDGEPVFRDGAENWKSVVTGKQIEVTSWCELPKRERC